MASSLVPQIIEEDLNPDFVVGAPEERGMHMEYKVSGKDHKGQWEGFRRYNHFHLLHEALSKRWPGIGIPRIPPKKAIGRFEVKFLQERRFYLERFLRKCG